MTKQKFILILSAIFLSLPVFACRMVCAQSEGKKLGLVLCDQRTSNGTYDVVPMGKVFRNKRDLRLFQEISCQFDETNAFLSLCTKKIGERVMTVKTEVVTTQTMTDYGEAAQAQQLIFSGSVKEGSRAREAFRVAFKMSKDGDSDCGVNNGR